MILGRVSVVIYPGAEVAQKADRIRRRFDPHVELVGPHLTIAFPDVLRADSDPVALLEAVASSLKPFHIELGSAVDASTFCGVDRAAMDFLVQRYPNARGLVASVAGAGADTVLAIRQSLNTAIPQPVELIDFAPYLTLGQSLDDPAPALGAAADFGPVRFRVEALELLAEGPDGAWSTVRRAVLGG